MLSVFSVRTAPPARASVLVAAVWLALFGLWLPASTDNARAQARSGRVLAVIGRQVGFLNFDAPRPRILTSFSAPSFAIDVAASPSATMAAISVGEPFEQRGDLGGDILGLDLTAPEEPPFALVSRTDGGEWLGAPAWLPDGSALLFQREDVRAGSDLNAGQAAVRYASRIDMIPATGGLRSILIADGHHPSPAPDGAEIAFIRLSTRGPALVALDTASHQERTLVPPGTVPDLAYPRYSPQGDRLAFVATTASAYHRARGPICGGPISTRSWFAPSIAFAHGLLWNLWVVNRDSSGLRQLAPVGADDASVSWSPDGTTLFVYGSTGARLVDAATGETDLLPYLAGFGATSWLPVPS